MVFLVLHGTFGEDGQVQQLDKLGAIYTGCDAEASRIAFDKVLTKKKCVAAGIPTAKFIVADSPLTPFSRCASDAIDCQARPLWLQCGTAIY